MTESPVGVSIVIPTRNRKEQLSGCLRALSRLKPPARGFEVIVVDDGSDHPLDGSVAKVADGLEVRIHRQANLGPGAARNAGAADARGELLAFLDDDVQVAPDWLSAMEEAHCNMLTAALGGRVDPRVGTGRAAEVSELIVDLASERREQPANPRFLPSSNLVVPARDFRLLGGFDERFLFAEDRELCRRWRASGRPLMYVDRARCHHAKTLSTRRFARQHFGYGSGAFDFWRTRPDPGGLREAIEPDFYRRVVAEVGRALRRGSLARAGLLVLWQLANAAGYASAAVRSAWRRADARPPGETPGATSAGPESTGTRT